MAEVISNEIHVAILPSPGMGHLIPLVEFAKRLVRLEKGISVTFLIPTDGPPSKAQKSIVDSLPPSIDSVFLPPVDFSDLSEGAKIETIISLTVLRSLPAIREVLKSISEKKNLVSLVVDLFGTDAFDVAGELNISPFIFFCSTAMALSLFLYLHKLDETVSCEYRELKDPVMIPGCIPIRGEDLLDPVQDRKNESYKWLLHHTERYRLADGIIANSFPALEGGALKALQEKEPGKPPVYAIGPLVNMDPTRESDSSECLTWLDNQPRGSVLYVSFGSGGSLSNDQINELAFGLEMSEQRFLWVVRAPNNSLSNATYFGIKGGNECFDFLPEGFQERTKGRGFLIPSWAPQAEVLSHSSTGGFLTHCGWNSTLESVVNGVPLIAWPLFAEQKMNAVSLAEDVKVALRLKSQDNGLIGRVEIAKVVKCLMEGEEGKQIRFRMNNLKDAAAKVLSPDGSSTKALIEVVEKWQSR